MNYEIIKMFDIREYDIEVTKIKVDNVIRYVYTSELLEASYKNDFDIAGVYIEYNPQEKTLTYIEGWQSRYIVWQFKILDIEDNNMIDNIVMQFMQLDYLP